MIQVVNIVPKSLSGDTNQDSEPNLAVNPSNPMQIAATAFTPDPLGGANAPLFVSNDGGQTWRLNPIVPSQAGRATGDITVRFSPKGGRLYAGILRFPGSLRLNILRTNNFLGASAMTVLVDRNGVDQPYVEVGSPTTGPDAGKDRVFVGDNSLAASSGSGGDGRTARIEVSEDGAVAAPPPASGFSSVKIESRSTSGQDGPPIRPAVHDDGTVYGAFYHWTSFDSSTGKATVGVVVVRDDNWGSGATPFTALNDPSDHVAGRLVASGRTLPFLNTSQPTFGQERLVGSDLTIAVDPRNSANVWLGWADRVGAADYTLHVRHSTDKGVTWSNDVRTITNAKSPALAVNNTGQVGFLYQQVTGGGAAQRWVTHFERTNDAFATIDDKVLATVPANSPAPTFLPYLGDYLHLMSVGATFFGIFSAANIPDHANFPQGVVYQRNSDFASKTLFDIDGHTPVSASIDPFFFKVTADVPVPHTPVPPVPHTPVPPVPHTPVPPVPHTPVPPVPH
ncbi:MAG: hypothetical protein M3Z50_00860, partial [Actinomycetota bacterium]|nr:hypothetical protein [Actinomycetota bacterium]